MNKKEKYLIGVSVFVILLVLGLWYSGLASNNPTTADLDKEINMTIVADGEIITEDTLDVADDSTLLDIMSQHYDLVVTDDGFIESIEGIDQVREENLFWVYEVNDETINEGAADFVPEEGDHIVWELTAF
ncbi:DUF4430 domain-containing protein [Alkalibacterium pelagium]|jgi:hypothetical protein|uniref:Transcobalamin-like C-terminal domain-containing protein n=1 Tax=Alkalibacterium pelagium TaxID=426702 RepID=A0A1H7LJG5_9LACT|nr:DUF4430 domain-containing protein [Alkalibacterium pelagium]GEN50873.1 hypothetical protein APE02nite_15380 [Alkalibacterium pelagium]SEK98625.1 protein of unknown function [Alkalibacterium pelagium]